MKKHLKKVLFPYGTLLALLAVLLYGGYTAFTSRQATDAASSSFQSVSVTAYSDQGTMADGHQAHFGACAALTSQFPFGTEVQLFNANNPNQAQIQCVVEDTGSHVCQNTIDVAMPGHTNSAIQFGRQQMLLKVIGRDAQIASDAVANHVTGSGCSAG